MPGRNRFIAPRAHPLALAAYLVIFLLGLLNIINLFESTLLDQIVGIGWRYVWEWLLTIGGTLSIIGALWPRDLDDALFMERTGSTASFFGLTTYTGVIVYVVGWSSIGWLLIGCLALGCGLRSIQITVEIRRVAALTHAVAQARDDGPPQDTA